VDPEGKASIADEVKKKGYRFVRYAGDLFHGGEHWHVYKGNSGKLLGRVSLSGEVLTGNVPKKALKILTKFGKIGGLAIGIVLELADPAIAGDGSALYDEWPPPSDFEFDDDLLFDFTNSETLEVQDVSEWPCN
jgi:hypothetical protein